MKSLKRKQGRYMVFIISLAAIWMLLCWDIAYAQQARRVAEKISRYEMDGLLQAFNLDEKWALIGGYKWGLADTFNTKEFAAVLGVQESGTVKFSPKLKTWATYYVILQTSDVSSLEIKGKETDRREIKLIIDPDVIKKIYESGGKIYKIEPCGE